MSTRVVFTPEALYHLITEAGPGQIMIDYPFPWTSTEDDLLLNTPD